MLIIKVILIVTYVPCFISAILWLPLPIVDITQLEYSLSYHFSV